MFFKLAKKEFVVLLKNNKDTFFLLKFVQKKKSQIQQN